MNRNAHPRPHRTFCASVGASVLLAAGAAACLTTGARSGGELQARFATVHNALSAIGMSEVGALHAAHVGDGVEGQEAKIDLELASGCTTIVAVGAASIPDLQAALINATGGRVARGTAHTSDATIRACNDAAGTYTLKLKAVHGAGEVLVSTWSGATPVDLAGASRHVDGGGALGTCEAPLPLSAGDFTGSTLRGEHQNEPKGVAGCSKGTGPEMVYRLDLTAREKVTIAVETPETFDSVLYVRSADCSDSDAEVACNDDAPTPGTNETNRQHSRIEQVLDAGTYFVFVDGYSGAAGSFKMHVELADVPPLAELCNKAPLLADGTPTAGTTEGGFDNVSAACGDGAHGPDSVYTLTLPRRSRARVVLHAEDFPPVVHLRSRCDDAESAVGCADTGGAEHEATFLGLLDAGSYAVFADSSQRGASGAFTLTAETAPELGSGVRGERCRDAIPLTKSELSVSGDTFAARDDVAGQCGGTGAPDVVYRLDVAARTHFAAHITREEGPHVLILLRGCEAPKAEIECGKAIDRVLLPGSYFLAVDGESPASFGAFTFDWSAHDTQAQDAACRAPPRLREGQSVTGTTLGGAVDKFAPSCGTTDGAGGAPDVVYEIDLAARRRVHLRLHSGGWGAVLSVRKSCLEGDTAAMSASEVECRAEESADVDFDAALDAGKYFVIVDGKEASDAGPFTLDFTADR